MQQFCRSEVQWFLCFWSPTAKIKVLPVLCSLQKALGENPPSSSLKCLSEFRVCGTEVPISFLAAILEGVSIDRLALGNCV